MLPLAILMSRDLKVVPATATLKEASCLMRDKSIGSLLILQNDHHIGIVSETDFVRRGIAQGLDMDKVSVQTVMSSPIISIDIEKTAEEANALMSEKGIRHLAITEQGKIVGILSVRDLLIYFKNQF